MVWILGSDRRRLAQEPQKGCRPAPRRRAPPPRDSPRSGPRRGPRPAPAAARRPGPGAGLPPTRPCILAELREKPWYLGPMGTHRGEVSRVLVAPKYPDHSRHPTIWVTRPFVFPTIFRFSGNQTIRGTRPGAVREVALTIFPTIFGSSVRHPPQKNSTEKRRSARRNEAEKARGSLWRQQRHVRPRRREGRSDWRKGREGLGRAKPQGCTAAALQRCALRCSRCSAAHCGAAVLRSTSFT